MEKNYNEDIKRFVELLQEERMNHGGLTNYETSCGGRWISHTLIDSMRSIIKGNKDLGIVFVTFAEEHYDDMVIRKDGNHFYVRVKVDFKFKYNRYVECVIGIIMV